VVESGGKWWEITYVCLEEFPISRDSNDNHYVMTFFTSEYESKIDAKGRLILPARIKSQLPALQSDNGEGESYELVVRRGFEQCLILYPMVEFKKVFSKISALNEFNEEYRKLQRNFLSGVVTLELDSNGRFLLPKNMLAYAKIEKEAMLIGMGNKVEIWNPEIYQKHLISDPAELSKLAEKHLNE
jgi:MraZ protein